MITLDNIETLLGQFQGPGLMVSCYADMSVAEGFREFGSGMVKTKAHEFKKLLADDSPQWEELKRNLAAVQRALKQPEAKHARGMAVFAALQRDFFVSLPLEVPVRSDVVLHSAPYLVPLLEIMQRQHEILVVHADTHRARLYLAAPGSLRLLEELDEEVPKKQRSSGERWGKEQATIARHREDVLLHFQKQIVTRIETLWGTHDVRGLILLGEHTLLEHLRKHLPARLRAQVVDEAPCAWDEDPMAQKGEIENRLCAAAERRERRAMETLCERMEQKHAVAVGPKDVLDALQHGRIGREGHGYVILGPDGREAVARCSACRWLDTEMFDRCSRCGAHCDEASLWEEILLFAHRHQIAVEIVKPDPLLTSVGGVAAVVPVAEKERDLAPMAMSEP